MRTYSQTRAKGTGTITRESKGRHGWKAASPHSKTVPKVWLGHFDTYREAERALDAFIADSRGKVA